MLSPDLPWLSSNRLFTVSYFSVGFSRLKFDQTAAILVFNSKCNLRGPLVRVHCVCACGRGGRGRKNIFPFSLSPTPTPLGSLDTLPRLPALTNQDGGSSIEASSLENPTEKSGTVNSLVKQSFDCYTDQFL